jgi:ankyrin repeat protein
MKKKSIFSRICRSPILRFAGVTLIVLAWNSLAFCGEIHDAAQKGDLEKVKALLKNHPDLVSSKDEGDGTPLYWAVANNHKDVVELLLASNADVNAKALLGQTPLDAVGQKDIAELLLAHGAKDENGGMPLYLAVANNHKDVVELLLTSNADVNAKGFLGQMPLDAVGQKDIAELLLAHGAEVNAKDNQGKTPLFWAAFDGHKNVVEVLLANKADVNVRVSSNVIVDRD